jgi:hypothetical protein
MPAEPKKPLDEMTPQEQSEYLHRRGLESGNRYAGKPELLIKEQPHRDFRRFEDQKKLENQRAAVREADLAAAALSKLAEQKARTYDPDDRSPEAKGDRFLKQLLEYARNGDAK